MALSEEQIKEIGNKAVDYLFPFLTTITEEVHNADHMGKGMTVLRSLQRKLVPARKCRIMQANLTVGNSKEASRSGMADDLVRSEQYRRALCGENCMQGFVRGRSGNWPSYLDEQ